MDTSPLRSEHTSPAYGDENPVTIGYSRVPASSFITANNNNNNNVHSFNKNHHLLKNSRIENGSKMTVSNSQRTVKVCSGCGESILDRYLLHALDRFWHTNCLKCSCCDAQLGEIGSSCFTKNGLILCKNDYIRMFGSGGSCASCGQTIPASEFVMKVQGTVYHQKCFTCVACQCQLMPGDRYSILNGSLLCEQDYPKVLKGHLSLPNRTLHKVC